MDDETKTLLQIRIARVVYRAELRRTLRSEVPATDESLAAVRDRCLTLLADTELALNGHSTATVTAALRDARRELAD
jgi:hypothetical protein